MTVLSCIGTLTSTDNGSGYIVTCSQPWEFITPTVAAGIDAPTILYIYSWGVGAVLMAWALGIAVRSATDVIKKL